jgi:hypothetical protein
MTVMRRVFSLRDSVQCIYIHNIAQFKSVLLQSMITEETPKKKLTHFSYVRKS